MQAIRNISILGKYAIYARALSDVIIEHRKAFFGRSSPHVSHSIPSMKHKQQHETEKSSQSEEPNQSAKAKALHKLEGVVEKAQNILIKSTAVFPFDLFPDSITIDRQKLTVVHRNFFSVKQTVSVQHSDIKNIQADIGPLFGSLTVTSEHFINNTQTIRYLPKKEVLAIQQLVQGFIVAHNESIDLTDIDDQKLVKLLNQLGRGEAGERVVLPQPEDY